MKQSVMEVVNGHFRPEFINRIDETVVFHPLSKDQLGGIAKIQLALLNARLLEREIQLEISESVVEKLVSIGFDPVYGARPLKRAIQHYLENPLAQEILRGKFAPGALIKTQLNSETDQIEFTV